MPFDVKGLNRLYQLGTSGTLQPTNFWGYVTADAHATIIAANYFNAQAQHMRVGDIILATTAIGGTPLARMYVVTAVTATTVTIAAVTGAGWT